MTFSPIANLAIRAARRAGTLAIRFFDRRHQLEVVRKEGSQADFVSNADTEVERELIYHLAKVSPDYGFLAEESGEKKGREGWNWILDPIDGTTNFLQGVPHFAISIALVRETEVQLGLIFDPLHNEMFLAEKGRGAFLNDHRMRVSNRQNLSQALLATAFPFKNKDKFDHYLEPFTTLFHACGDIRRSGSASLDLAYTAAGRFDGYWEMGLSAWDIAAGSLILQEAGGFISDFSGDRHYMEKGEVLAANPLLHSRMLDKIRATRLTNAKIDKK
ncbi:MAG: inositol monophosphatase [Magnetococcus sp. DMHC-6]